MRLFSSVPIYRSLRAGVSVRPQDLGPINRIGLWFGRRRFAANLLPAPTRWIAQSGLYGLAAIVWVGVALGCTAVFAMFCAGFSRR